MTTKYIFRTYAIGQLFTCIKADIWSLGITVYEMATGNPPLANVDPMRAISIIPKSPPPKLAGTFSLPIREFIDSCLSEHPNEVIILQYMLYSCIFIHIIATECRRIAKIKIYQKRV